MIETYLWKHLQAISPMEWICLAIFVLSTILWHCKVYLNKKKTSAEYGLLCYARGNKKQIMATGLMWYVGAVFCMVILTRSRHAVQRYHLIPLWSWGAAIEEIVNEATYTTMEQILINLIILIPAGVLLHFINECTVKKAILLGFSFSCFMEILQLVFWLGEFEWDDMIHNAIGCAVGVWIGRMVKRRNRK